LDAEVNFFDRFETEIDERDEPPDDAPSDEEAVRKWPLVELHVPNLNPPNLEG
jgi:hypothetical protein